MIGHVLRLWLLLSLATLLAGVLLVSTPVRAEEDLNHAGLVVRDGDGRLTYAWVPFREDEIDGIELLERSGIPVVTVGFGALGEAVCAIGGEGCGVSECQRNVCQGSAADAPYWQYFRQDPNEPSVWTWQPLGASSSEVTDGDVFGWSWTAAEPGLPVLPAAEIARLAGAGDGEGSAPAVRTVVPEGVSPAMPMPPPDIRTTGAAGAILAAITVSGFVLASRRRSPSGGSLGFGVTTALASLRPPSASLLPPPASCGRHLDPRAWLLWAIAATLPPLLGRNPWPLAATLLAVLAVWGAWSTGAAGARWRPLLRLALVFGALSILFNLLTAHVGDRVIAALPEHWRIVGGPLTLNALIYGLLGAMAILSLVIVGATLGATLDWSVAMRLLPERMAPLAVAGSIAWSYLPRTTVALAEIREAQTARGYRPRGVRDAAPLVIPLLAGGLERAMITAEALEARAFGAPLSPNATPRPWQVAALVTGLVAAVTGAFCLALGLVTSAVLLLALAGIALVLGLNRLGSRDGPRRTRYRDPVWESPEWTVSGAAIAVLAVEIAVLVVDPAAFRYEPYPTLTAPAINLPLLAALGLLLAPAALTPSFIATVERAKQLHTGAVVVPPGCGSTPLSLCEGRGVGGEGW